jgi:hypothetical protein
MTTEREEPRVPPAVREAVEHVLDMCNVPEGLLDENGEPLEVRMSQMVMEREAAAVEAYKATVREGNVVGFNWTEGAMYEEWRVIDD